MASLADAGLGVTSLPSKQLGRSKTSKTHTSRTLKVGAGGTSLCLRRWSRSSVCVGSERGGRRGRGGGGHREESKMRGSAHHLLNWDPVQRCLPSWSTPSAPKTDAQGPAARSILPCHSPEPSTSQTQGDVHPTRCRPVRPCETRPRGPGGAASCGHSSGASETTSTRQTKS